MSVDLPEKVKAVVDSIDNWRALMARGRLTYVESWMAEFRASVADLLHDQEFINILMEEVNLDDRLDQFQIVGATQSFLRALATTRRIPQ